ncbi:hypothetical protein CFC21_050008 [Triticum aestivum]|uniref:F-box domain-containing protein n=2 Tax=Triticum aestivum TaxID=4565 RepID=A0A3B6H5T9_WHEAT|nr:hypothetical protein CFC21_050008 [Triticum aestivum]
MMQRREFRCDAAAAMGTSLPEELHLEILRRLSPTPQVLARASAVCREWRRVVNSPEFLQELYLARRGAPVTMGFFHNAGDDEYPRRFVEAQPGDPLRLSFKLIYRMINWQFVDCRHGRVLLMDRPNRQFLLWHPMSSDHHLVLKTPPVSGEQESTSVTLICDCGVVPGDDEANKIGQRTSCHVSHFGMAIVCNHSHTGCLGATIYSSVTGEWSSPLHLPNPARQIRPEPCAVISKTFYQPLCDYLVLAYDTEQGSLTMFERPKCGNIRLFKADNGVLGLAGVLGFTLRLWARYANAWVLQKLVDLTEILHGLSTAPSPRTEPLFNFMPPVKIIGVADQGDVLFLWTMIGIFMLCPETMEVKKVHQTAPNMNTVYPYGAFYVPPAVRTQTLTHRTKST